MAGTVTVAFPEDDLPAMLCNQVAKPKVDLNFGARAVVCGRRRGAHTPGPQPASGLTLSIEPTDLLSVESLECLMDALFEGRLIAN